MSTQRNRETNHFSRAFSYYHTSDGVMLKNNRTYIRINPDL